MRVLVQRCKQACCKVDNKTTGQIDDGFVLFVGFTEGDNKETITAMVKKVVNLRIFPDENGVMNLSILEAGGSTLSISQFTLYADTHKGNRPSYIKAMTGSKAILLYDYFNQCLKEFVPVETGIFGVHMEISLTNVGPTTILLER